MIIYPGQVLNDGDMHIFTLGYGAVRKSDKAVGIVTCGHIGLKVGDYIYKDGTPVAIIQNLRFDAWLDASFATLATGITVKNTLQAGAGSEIIKADSNVMTGACIRMCCRGDKLIGGKVINPSQKITYDDGSTYYDLIECSYDSRSEGGDSGSPVVVLGRYIECSIIGIHVAIYGDEMNPRELIMKADKINQEFGLEMLR